MSPRPSPTFWRCPLQILGLDHDERISAPANSTRGDFEVVGVVEDTAYTDVRWKNHSMFFLPIMQRYASDKDSIENGYVALCGSDDD
jgi:hypothetical protein